MTKKLLILLCIIGLLSCKAKTSIKETKTCTYFPEQEYESCSTTLEFSSNKLMTDGFEVIRGETKFSSKKVQGQTTALEEAISNNLDIVKNLLEKLQKLK